MNTPKFKKGDWIKRKKDCRIARVVMLLKTCYDLSLTDGESWWLDYDFQDNWELTDAPPKNKLEEAAGEYEKNHTYQRYDGGDLTPEYDATLAEAFIAGYNLCREQMMKDAVEATVENGIFLSSMDCARMGYNLGDKVRIIIVKED